MDINLSKGLIQAKEEHPDFEIDEKFLFDFGKELESFFLAEDKEKAAERIDRKFALMVSKVFTELTISTIPFDSKESLYFLMMGDYYRFALEKKLSSLMESFGAYLTMRYVVFALK